MPIDVSGQGVAGSGTATEAKQDTQITAEEAIQAGIGAVADAAATAGSTGSLSAKLRLITSNLATMITSLLSNNELVAERRRRSIS